MHQFADFEATAKRDPAEAKRKLFAWLQDDDERASLYRCLLTGHGILRFESQLFDQALQRDVSRPVYFLTAAEHIGEVLTNPAAFSNAPYRFTNSADSFMLARDATDADHAAQRGFGAACLQVNSQEMNAIARLAFYSAAVLPLKHEYFDLAEFAEQVALRFVGLLFGYEQAHHPWIERSMRLAYRGLNHLIIGRHFLGDDKTIRDDAVNGLGALIVKTKHLIQGYRRPDVEKQKEEFAAFDAKIDRQFENLPSRSKKLKQLMRDRVHFANDIDESKRIEEELNALLLEIDPRKTQFTSDVRDWIRRKGDLEARERLDPELDELRDCKEANGDRRLTKFTPLLRAIANMTPPQGYTDEKLALIVVGMISGTVHNVQSAICVTLKQFFSNNNLLEVAKNAAVESFKVDAASENPEKKLTALIWEALRLNPPATFLHRQVVKQVRLGSTWIEPDAIVLLGMGGAARDLASADNPDEFREDRPSASPYVFGGTSRGRGLHECLGTHIAMPLIMQTVRRLLLLDGIMPADDPLKVASPLGLTKEWGVICKSYPFRYNRGHYLVQSPLIVVMDVKEPVQYHEQKLVDVIRHGAPIIEKKLRDAKHVHYAYFRFAEEKRRGENGPPKLKLVLYTLYDGSFDAYIEHFALKVGPLFDRLFEHIEDAPPMPVEKHPEDFVKLIRRYNQAPEAGYIFSAYPRITVSMIDNEFRQEQP